MWSFFCEVLMTVAMIMVFIYVIGCIAYFIAGGTQKDEEENK